MHSANFRRRHVTVGGVVDDVVGELGLLGERHLAPNLSERFLAIDAVASLVAFLLERQEDRRLLLGVFFQRFCYRQLMYYVGLKALAMAVKGRIIGWSKFERKATVATVR